jgi:hypothetical protein
VTHFEEMSEEMNKPAMVAALLMSTLYNDRYGDSIIHPPADDGSRKVEGKGEGGVVRARCTFAANGAPQGAWDPDYLLDKFVEGWNRMADAKAAE